MTVGIIMFMFIVVGRSVLITDRTMPYLRDPRLCKMNKVWCTSMYYSLFWTVDVI